MIDRRVVLPVLCVFINATLAVILLHRGELARSNTRRNGVPKDEFINGRSDDWVSGVYWRPLSDLSICILIGRNETINNLCMA